MIVSDRWIWLHVPKCAGTATEKILHAAFKDDPGVDFDPVAPGLPVIWHDGLADRAARVEGFAPRGRAVVANIRRLPLWLLSRVHFEVQRYGPEAIVQREVLVSGRFRPVPLGVPKPLRRADDELARYLPGVTHWLRTEHLAEDIPAAFGIKVPARRARDRVNATTLDYIRDPAFWFTAAELRGLYAANPLWAKLEAEVYGDHLTLPPDPPSPDPASRDPAPGKHGVYKSTASV